VYARCGITACPVVFVLAVIPCYCELAHNRSGNIFIVKNPKHKFRQAMREVLEKIEAL